MPPNVPRKRLREASTSREAKTPTKDKGKAKASQPRKLTLFDDLDVTNSPSLRSGNSSLRHLEEIDGDDSPLSSLSDADFEDVHVQKKPKLSNQEDDDDDDDEDIEFEDVETSHFANEKEAPLPSGDLELTLTKDTRVSLTNAFGDKKGPSKRERAVRNATHCVHVQSLMWHNAVRNSWLCDPELQGILLSHLPGVLWEEVDRWRRDSGLEVEKEQKPSKGAVSKAASKKPPGKRSREWGEAATRLERGAVDMSHGDPLFILMKALSAWWKKRFKVTAPGIRKLGYMSLERLDRLMKAYLGNEHSPQRFGEKVASLQTLRELAQQCAGSRDVGAQLFTALLRGLGLEARMVASLQPLGFGWNKMEDADPEKDDKTSKTANKSGESAGTARAQAATSKRGNPRQRSTRAKPKRMADDDLDNDSDLELVTVDSDDDSAVEIPQTKRASSVSYDKDLAFPHCWTEVLSPATRKYLVVDPIVKFVLGTNRDLIESLEPRGAKADKARQVMAYIVGFSPDGTAKDVTVRYLKRQMLPGRTKGARMPAEKIPVYDKHGKVKRYEQFDWFRSVMRGYTRGSKLCPITDADDEEDSADLKPVQPQKKEVKEGEETLQYYKQSAEFVLERHLKREEALLPDAPPVKVFRAKAKGGEAVEESVHLRKNVVNVKSAETWHKQGRAPILGERPLKRVPYRAATTNRRREIAEAEAATGEKALQGLYSFEQTEWIIPNPIENGVIPKNEYGNIDLFVEHMCPEGAVHVPYRGAVKVCKRLEIDFAEAVVDFEFGHRMAVPVIQGVVIAQEYHDQVMEELAKDETERSRKEDEKRRAAALSMWRKMVMGLRIVKRIQEEYGEVGEDEVIFKHGRSSGAGDRPTGGVDEETAGGFLPEGFEEEAEEEAADQTSAFFPVDDDSDEAGDTLFVENDGG